ncbi:MAG: monovalent cation/H+ antiporter complex subunit F [Actinomycetota bacterium]|nr:monovalent cation/H+ antiporter complex subunit F [Actinomycetota bacterium]
MIGAAFVLLGLAAVCFALRLVIGPRLSDRVMALDGLVIVGVSTVALRAMSTGDGSFLPVLVVVTLVGFVGTAASARFIEGHSNRDRVVPDGESVDLGTPSPGGDDGPEPTT